MAQSVEEMKAQNKADGCLIGMGRKKSMRRRYWEPLQYALDELADPKADFSDLMMALRILDNAGITYAPQEIPWMEISNRYPTPPPRKIMPYIHPGPVEDDIEALAVEYGYPKIVAEPLSDDPDVDLEELAWELALAEAEDLAGGGPYVGCLVIPTLATVRPEFQQEYPVTDSLVNLTSQVSPVVAEPVAAPAEIKVEIPAPTVEGNSVPPACASLTEKITWHIQHGVRDLPVLAKGCGRDYAAVCRSVTTLKQQKIIHMVDGGWEMVTKGGCNG